MWNSRPPHPSWKKTILNFHFDYLIISLRKSCSSSRPVGIERTDKGCPSQLFRYLFCVFLHNFGSFREASVPQIAFRSPSSEVVIGIPVPSVEKSTNPSGDKSGR